ncbi:MAG: transglutaminase domain-containing protein [Pseudomonadota bacterium]
MNATSRFWCGLALALHAAHGAADVAVTDYVTFAANNGDNVKIAEHLRPYYEVDYSDDHGEFTVLRDHSLEIEKTHITATHTVIRRFQTQEEIQEDGNSVVHVNPFSTELTIAEAYVVQPNGDVIGVDPSTIQIENDTADDVFGDFMVVTIPWPALQEGSFVTLQVIRRTEHSKRATPWSHGLYLQGYDYVHDLRLSARWADDSLKPVWKTQADFLTCTNPDARRLDCRASAIPGFQTDDSANYYDLLPQVIVAPQLEWSEIGERLHTFMSQALSESDQIARTAAKLTENADSDQDKLSSILKFVAGEIRYVGLEHGYGSHVPRPSDTTLERRFGDCKDKTVLLIDLLQSVGIEATPVFVASRRTDPSRLLLPSANYFDHVIACGSLRDGARFCVDPTDPYSGSSYTNPSIQGLVGYAPDRDSRPIKIPSDRTRWYMREDMTMELDSEGNLKENLSVTYLGPYAASIRSGLAGLTDEERSEWALDVYQSTVSDLVEPAFEFSGIDNTEDDLQVDSSVVYEEILDPDVDLDYRESASWLRRLAGYFETENEHYGFDFEGMKFVGRVKVVVDEKWQINRLSPTVDFQTRFGRLERNQNRKGNVVYINTEVDMRKQRIEPDDFEDFNTFISHIRQFAGFRILGELQ